MGTNPVPHLSSGTAKGEQAGMQSTSRIGEQVDAIADDDERWTTDCLDGGLIVRHHPIDDNLDVNYLVFVRVTSHGGHCL